MRGAGVDLFNVSSPRLGKPEWPDSMYPALTIAEWARRLTDAPVMTCGSVGLDVEMFADLFDGQKPRELTVGRDLKDLAGHVHRGMIDLVGVGRMHIANSDFVNKVRDGRYSERALFDKRIHLAQLLSAGDPGFVAESHKSTAAD
jgi:2,4-dienoyl-CoA reductase-like NADH-dependent reductase (Old Yellow Enzyme family)